MSGTDLISSDISRAITHDVEFCPNDNILLTAVPGFNANTCRWYASATDTVVLATDTVFSPVIASTTTFYVASYNTLNGIESPERVPLTVELQQGLYREEFADVCVEDMPYLWNNQTYYESGTFEQVIPTVNGCDSTFILHLAVHQRYNLGDYAEICENELPYTWNGVTFQSAGVETVTLPSAYGCDSVVTMRLVVLHSADVQEERTICSAELPYSWNGFEFEDAGVQVATFPIPGGCDSTVTMVLTVNPSYSVEDTMELSVNELPYEWNGVVFTEAGSQTVTLTTAEGCDSVVSMYLLTPDAVSDFAAADFVRVWPNPSEGVFHFSTNLSHGQVMVFDVYGKMVMVKEITDGVSTLDLSGCADGMYLLKVTDGAVVKRTLKLVKR
ncbi:MAG: T9SS type A sorting domain-containing protein [Bacteroidales bacterium]|nr:T9SS type A sorting domain-containing protein [Bacteroidales bacterium]